MTTEIAEGLLDLVLRDVSQSLGAGNEEETWVKTDCPGCVQRVSCVLLKCPEQDDLWLPNMSCSGGGPEVLCQ